MALDIDSLAVDSIKAREGVWVDHMGGRFKIARYSNPEADMGRKQVQLKFYQQLKEQMDNKTKDKEEAFMEDYQKEMAAVVAEHILVDWDELTRGGKPWKYSVEDATELLCNPNFYEFYQFVLEQSLTQDNFKLPTQEVAEDVKPSAEA